MRRRVPFSTPAAASVPVPSTEDTVVFLASCSSAQAAAMLALLNIEAGAGSTLTRKAERVAELSHVLRVYPNYARAAHWHSLLVAAGDVLLCLRHISLSHRLPGSIGYSRGIHKSSHPHKYPPYLL